MHYGDNKPKYIRWVIYAAVITGAVLLQNSVGGLTEIFGARIFLAVPLCVSIAMVERELPAALAGAFAGILWDVSCGADGFNAIVLMLIPAVCSLLISHFMRNNIITAIVLCVGSTLFYEILYIIVNLIGKGIAFKSIFSFYLPSFIITVAVMPVFYDIVKAIYKNFRTTDESGV